MHLTHIWHKFYLHRTKVATLALLGMLLFSRGSYGQRQVGVNNPNYDDKRLKYGFLIGFHNSSYQLKYSEYFLNLNNLHSIQPQTSPGFSLGFILNLHLLEYLDIRLLPKVSFYEYAIEYNYIDKPVVTQLVESTVVEFPLLLKYKSQRRKNTRMYLVGGVKPGIEAAAKNNIENKDDAIPLKMTNISLDLGLGFDLYYPLFKFSPELLFSKGIENVLGTQSNDFSQGIQSLHTNTVTLSFFFQ